MTIREMAVQADTTAYDDCHGSNMFRDGFTTGARKIIEIVHIFAISKGLEAAEFDKFLESYK